MYDPNFSANSIPPETIPALFWRSGQDQISLCEITTGRPVFTLPPDTQPVLIDFTGRTLVVQEFSAPALQRVLDYLQQHGVAIPNFLWSLVAEGPNARWSILDIASGRTIATMPAQYEITWLSRDEKTWVTVSQTAPTTINVWDFPPRPSYYEPLAYSMLAPVLIVLLSRLRRLSAVKLR